MDEPFEIPVGYKGQELLFPAYLQQSRFTHRFAVDVYGQEIFFERDEEGSYRALIDREQLKANRKLEIELLRAIAEAIEAILR
jgi:hypothetical protein